MCSSSTLRKDMAHLVGTNHLGIELKCFDLVPT